MNALLLVLIIVGSIALITITGAILILHKINKIHQELEDLTHLEDNDL